MENHKPRLTPAALGALFKGDFHNASLAATPGGIEAQEKAGQLLLTLKFNQLPKDGMAKYRAELERLGFSIGKDADDIFVNVTPPDGWRLQPTDHAMWSTIRDAQGHERGLVFYKAAFYDRNAYFTLTED